MAAILWRQEGGVGIWLMSSSKAGTLGAASLRLSAPPRAGTDKVANKIILLFIRSR